MTSASIASRSLCLGHLPAHHARYRPHRTAVVVAARSPREHEQRLDWREFDAYVNRWANALSSLGVGRGDRVATVLPNSLELLATYWACAKLGAAAVPLSPLLTTSGLKSLLADATPRVVLASSDLLAAHRGRAPRHRVAAGARPGCWSTRPPTTRRRATRAFGPLHGERRRRAARGRGRGRRSADADVHVGDHRPAEGHPAHALHPRDVRDDDGQRLADDAGVGRAAHRLDRVQRRDGDAVPAFLCGATYVLHRAFDAEAFIATVEAERVTHTMLVPSQIIAILNARGFDPSRLTSLEMILSLGAPLHREHKDRLNGCCRTASTSSTASPRASSRSSTATDALRKTGSVGVPPPFYEMRIVDDGRARCSARRSRRDRRARARSRWPATTTAPDATARDAARRLAAHRRPRLRRRGRLSLSRRPQEGHDRLAAASRSTRRTSRRSRSSIRRCARSRCSAFPHEKWGETPVAAIVLREPGSVTADEMRDWVNARVAAKYQRLSRVVVMDEFPRNAAGKTLKRELRAPFWKDQEAAI